MQKLPAMIDMARTPKDMISDGSGAIMGIGMLHDRYPCGLSISMDHIDLEKLGLDDNCDVGDILQGSILAKVTSVSRRDTPRGPECRVEMQITNISVGGEDAGYNPVEKAGRDLKRKLYDSHEDKKGFDAA